MQQQTADDRADDRQGVPAVDDPQERLAVAVRTAADHELDRDVAEVHQDDAEDADEHDAAAQQRRRRMQSVPLPVGEPGLGHSPALRLSASVTSVSRSSSASSAGSPGIVTPVAAAAVTNLSSLSPNARASGPRLTSTSCILP